MANATVIGSGLVGKNIVRYMDGFLKTANKTMVQVEKLLDIKVTQNISLSDHSLSDLRKLGHPYGRKHGESGLNLHNPNYQVHRQSGKLLDAKFKGTTNAEITNGTLEASAFVGIRENSAPHALYVILGTSKMIPRPFLQGSRNEVLPQAIAVIKNNLKNFTFGFK